MGTGWRRAFCTTIPRDKEAKVVYKLQQEQEHQNFSHEQIPSPRSCARFGLLFSGSNPSTPRLRCKTNAASQPPSTNDTPLISPKFHCKTTSNTPKTSTKNPNPRFGSNPSSPRSPFSILKNSLGLTRVSCSINVKLNELTYQM